MNREQLIHIHHQLLARYPYPIKGDVKMLSEEEKEGIRRYGFWLEALSTGTLDPITEAQEEFIKCCGRGLFEDAKTPIQRAWIRWREANRWVLNPKG